MEGDPAVRCRLCLHSDPQSDIFASDQELRHRRQVLQFLELDSSSHESLSPVCQTCLQTIQLLSAFGDLCRRSDRLLREAAQIVGVPWEQWDRCREHVSAAVEIVRSRCDELETYSGKSSELEIKEEDYHEVYLEEFDARDLGDSVEVKEEHLEASESEDVSEQEDQPPSEEQPKEKRGKGRFFDPNNTRRLELNEKLRLTELVREQELLWNIKHADYHNPDKRTEAWNQVASNFDIGVLSTRKEWRYLRDMYRNRLVRGSIHESNDRREVELFRLMDEILRNNTQPVIKRGRKRRALDDIPRDTEDIKEEEAASDESYDQRLQLAQELEAHLQLLPAEEVSHSNIPWTAVSERLGWDVDAAKRIWESSIRWYTLRIRKDDLQEDDRPLFDSVESLLNQLNNPAKPRAKKQVKGRRKFFDPNNSKRLEQDEKLRLAKLIREQELLWNTKHVDYQNLKKRAAAWDQVASNFDIGVRSTRKEWQYLRDTYRSRMVRTEGPIRDCDDPRDVRLFRLMDEMMRDNLHISKKDGQAKRPSASEEGRPLQFVTETVFRSEEQRVALAEEIAEHAVIWDCGNAFKRGEAWNAIATTLNCTRRELRLEWSRFTRQLAMARQSAQDLEAFFRDPMHKRLHQLIADVEASVTLPKRRYSGKRIYDPDGCLKTVVNGVTRYQQVCELCGKPVERSIFEAHMNQHNGLTPYACSFEGCGKSYGSKTSRDRHEVVAHSESGFKFECQLCGEKFKMRAKYEYHYAVKHKSEEVPCHICGKLLKHKSLLNAHVRKVHTSQHECTTCGKFYQSKWALTTHIRIHTNEKPFECELCGERFRIKVLKKRHLANVHNVQMEELEAAAATITA